MVNNTINITYVIFLPITFFAFTLSNHNIKTPMANKLNQDRDKHLLTQHNESNYYQINIYNRNDITSIVHVYLG